MQTILFVVGGKVPMVAKLLGIAVLVVLGALLLFGLITPNVNALIDVLTTTLKTGGGIAVMMAPVGFIKLQKMGVL